MCVCVHERELNPTDSCVCVCVHERELKRGEQALHKGCVAVAVAVAEAARSTEE